MSDEELREFLVWYLMEFGSGPVTVDILIRSFAYQSRNERVEMFSDSYQNKNGNNPVYFAFDPNDFTYTMTPLALAFIEGDSE